MFSALMNIRVAKKKTLCALARHLPLEDNPHESSQICTAHCGSPPEVQ